MKTELLQRQLDMLKIEYQKALSQNDRTEIKRLYDDIHNLVKEIEIAKGEEIVQKAKDSGILTKTSQIISLVQLLMCETNNLLSEIEDNFKSAQVMTDSIFLMQKEYYKSADLYFKEFAKIVKQNQMGSGMFSDLEEFDNMIRIFAGLKDMPKPSSLMGGCKQAAGKANGLSQMCQKCPLTYNPETLICQACDKSFKEGFQKGAKWLEKKRIDRIMNKDKEVQNDNRK